VIENEIGGSRKVRAIIFVALLVSTGGVVAALHFVNSYCSLRCPHSPSTACINNLRQIDGAKMQWALEKRKGTNDVPTAADISPYLIHQEIPKCGVGGVYTLGAVAESPRCSITGHVLQ
jgi:general secretion pathway protein G